MIKGVSLPVFIYNIEYNLSEIIVYEDGKIDCWGLLEFNDFVERVHSGWITTSVPEGVQILASPLGKFNISAFQTDRTENDLIKEVQDLLKKFNNKPTSGEICLVKFNAFRKKPTEKRKKELIKAYQAVPTHNRRFILNDPDVDDIPIKVIIYGDVVLTESAKAENQQEWILEHYLEGIEIENTSTE